MVRAELGVDGGEPLPLPRRVRLAGRLQIAQQTRRDRQPRCAWLQLEDRHLQAAVTVQLEAVADVADRLTVRGLHDAPFDARQILLALAEDLIVPQRRIADAGDQQPLGGSTHLHRG